MSIAEAIRNNSAALAAATAGDWPACAESLRAIKFTAEARKCGSKESSMSVLQAGADPYEMLETLRADAPGELLFNRLSDASEEGGVIWADPLTVPYLNRRESDFGRAVIDALVNLSAPVSHPFTEITPEQCASAWLSRADVRMMCNITDGVTALHFQVIRDGNPVRVVSLKEGTGSEIEQALLTAIETAIDAYLVGA